MGKRLFIGIKINPSVELIDVYNNLKSKLSDSGIKWAETNNFHLTLMFLGDVNNEKINPIIDKLKMIAVEHSSFKAELAEIGCFKKKGQTQVIWIGIDDNCRISEIAQSVNQSISELGFEPDSRPFKPHLTIGRVKTSCNEEILSELIRLYQNKHLQEFAIEEIILFESVLKPSGPIYKIVEKIKL